MAVKRSKNWLGQQRVDTTHLREVESAVVGDFDDLAGKILASSRPIVVEGMTISMAAAVGNFATQLILNTASGILLHGTASEPGAVFVVSPEQPAETLNTSNPSVIGSFTPNAINYIGIDLVRKADASTADIVKFRSATTKKEFSQKGPLARTRQYRIIISTSDFELLTNVAPVARVQLDASGIVQNVTDCREMMFRLGSGGSVPDPLNVFAWPGGRSENSVTSTDTTDPFSGADKSIASFIDFFHAMESRLWEVGGGEHWYSRTTDRDVLFVRDSTNVFSSDNENFEWVGSNLHWKGLSFSFGNSTSTRNPVADQLISSPGLTDLGVGQCLYVDLDRANEGTTLTMHKANLSNIGTPTIPGSRHIIAWRTTEGVFGLGSPYPVGYAFAHATNLAYGVTKLYSNAGTDAIVPGVNSSGQAACDGLVASGVNGLLETSSRIAGDSGTDFVFDTVASRSAGKLFDIRNHGSSKISVDHNGKLLIQPTASADASNTAASKGYADALMPVGVVLPFGGSSAPTNYLLCDGSAVNRTTYATLFGVIGTTYGVGNGTTTFNLPDMRGRAAVGAGTGVGLTARALGSKAGEETHQLNTTEMPSHSHIAHDPGHSHSISVRNNTDTPMTHAAGGKEPGTSTFVPTTESSFTGITISYTGGDGAHNNMQPFLSLNYIIRAI